MCRKSKVSLSIFVATAIAFIVWTLCVKLVDVRQIGEGATSVGLGAMNSAVFNALGVNMLWYTITDWLGLVPIGCAVGFGILGLVQLIARRSIKTVDFEILALGVFYIVVVAFYLFFEFVIVNYRPIILAKNPEASYPSSHTMVAVCVMTTAIYNFMRLIKRKHLSIALSAIAGAVIAVIVVGRLISGVHWISDIIGGLLLSISLVSAYLFAVSFLRDANTVRREC